MVGDLPTAHEHLEKAERIFNDSAKDDQIRKCELLRTRGLVKLKEGEGSEAVFLLQESLQFKRKHRLKSPCVEWVHLVDLARAQLEMGAVSAARKALGAAAKVAIDY